MLRLPPHSVALSLLLLASGARAAEGPRPAGEPAAVEPTTSGDVEVDAAAELGTEALGAEGDAEADVEGEAGTDAETEADVEGEADVEADIEADLEESAGGSGAPLYSADLSDAELERRFVEEPATLGSVSVGFSVAGRLINGMQMPKGEAWTVVVPELAWGTSDVIAAVATAAEAVRAQWPDAAPLRVNHIGKKDGGYLRPHRSHQSGRDVDLGLYYKAGVDPRRVGGPREQAMDPGPNWTLVRSLVTDADVKVILVDKRIQRVLYEYALAAGEDEGWLDSLFHAGPRSIFQHARGHRDHFHVRFFSPRAQELGRRIQPLLAKVPEQNLVAHRVRRGDTLSHIARRYGSTVKLIQRKNGMRGSFLRAGRVLTVPLRGPCTHCPLPPPLVVPPRRLPPGHVDEPQVQLARAVQREPTIALTFSTRSSGCLAP